MVKARLLSSHHGTNGGYVLARDARKISALEVIKAIDGPLFMTSCYGSLRDCGQSSRCTVREPLRKVSERIEQVLTAMKIADMALDSVAEFEEHAEKNHTANLVRLA